MDNKKRQRRITREVGLNRGTVAKYIKDYDQKGAQLMATAEMISKKKNLLLVSYKRPVMMPAPGRR